MKDYYGYIKRTNSEADGDHIDVFVGPAPDKHMVFVIDQVDPKTGKFDEVKCMIGYTTKAEAVAGYLKHYKRGWKGLGNVTSMPMGQFKAWLAVGDMGRPAARQTIKHNRGTGSFTAWLSRKAAEYAI
jgi:hypothetical protein